jgi:hypothetical protein
MDVRARTLGPCSLYINQKLPSFYQRPAIVFNPQQNVLNAAQKHIKQQASRQQTRAIRLSGTTTCDWPEMLPNGYAKFAGKTAITQAGGRALGKKT